jgi:hypothetical protein
MVQQRYRRMKIPEVVSSFDKHQISPGTPYMRELADTIRVLFPQCILSDTLEPGEGEHKLFLWLRTLADDDRKSICIYGLDADLVLISIAQSHLGDIEVLREREKEPGFTSLSIPALIKVLPLDPETYVKLSVMSFGNDFMPNLAMFSLREDGYKWRDDHGAQHHCAWTKLEAAGAGATLAHTLEWRRLAETIFREERTIAITVDAAARAWRLHWRSRLTNTSGRVLSLGNPLLQFED